MVRKSSYPKVFEFLQNKERLKESFSLKEVADFCGIKSNTIGKYFSEKLYNYVIKKEVNKKLIYKSKNTLNVTYEIFESSISQANPTNKTTEIQTYYKKIIDKSFDAFLIAIENYNKPNLKNKVEIFAILIINAWELLLKAKIIKDNNDKRAIYKEKKDKDDYTISIEDCVKRIYKNDKDPIRANLLQLIKLRDKATHLLVEEIRYSLSQIFQASIINYIEEYKNNFDVIPLSDDMTGMLCLIIPGNNKTSEIKNIYGEETEQEINDFLNELTKLTTEYNSDNFMTNINYNVYFSKKENNSDITITNGNDGKKAIIVEKISDPKDKYKYSYTEIISKIKEKYPKFNQYILLLFIRKYKIWEKSEYHYKFRNIKSYSEKLVNFITEEINNDPDFFDNIKNKGSI